MAYRFLHRRRVEFADTDAAGIMHFTNFFRFMEVAEHAFYRSQGLSVHPSSLHSSDQRVGWPRVHASADYRQPLFFEEEVEIELLVEELRQKTIHYYFQCWKNPDDSASRILAASGRFVVICVTADAESRRMKAVAIPEEWRERLEVAPAGMIPAPTLAASSQ